MMEWLPVVFRFEWGAKRARKTVRLRHPVELICFCWLPGVAPCYDQEGCTQRVRELQEKHMAMGLNDIHYNFIVGGDGLIYEGRGWFVRSSRTPEEPYSYGKRLDIAYIGEEKVDPFHPPHKQVPPALRLIHWGVTYRFIHHGYDVLEEPAISHTPSPQDRDRFL